MKTRLRVVPPPSPAPAPRTVDVLVRGGMAMHAGSSREELDEIVGELFDDETVHHYVRADVVVELATACLEFRPDGFDPARCCEEATLWRRINDIKGGT